MNDSFNVHRFVFNDKHDTQSSIVRDFVEYVKRIAESMSVIHEYKELFSSFNTNYIKICFFEANGAGDRVRYSRISAIE